MQIRCYFPDISYLSETQKNNFQFLNEPWKNRSMKNYPAYKELKGCFYSHKSFLFPYSTWNFSP